MPLTYSVTPSNGSNGAVLDLFFNSNPVLAGQTATFKVYTDNTQDQKLFGIIFNPSPVNTTTVPIPGALMLLGPGLVGLAAFRKKPRK